MSESGDTIRRNGFILKVAEDKLEVIYGGDYNPEQWPEEIWKEDADLLHTTTAETLAEVDLQTRQGTNLLTKEHVAGNVSMQAYGGIVIALDAVERS